MELKTYQKNDLSFYIIFLLGMIVAFLSTFPGVEDGFFVGKYLCAENGNVFIKQAYELVLSSIWTPYAGYIHAYPRLASLFGSFFYLASQPYILLGGGVLAYGLWCYQFLQCTLYGCGAPCLDVKKAVDLGAFLSGFKGYFLTEIKYPVVAYSEKAP